MPNPLINLTISYIIGIIIGKFFPIPPSVLYFLSVIAFVVFIYFLNKRFNIAILILVLLLGMTLYRIKVSIPINDISYFADDTYRSIIGKVIDEVKRNDNFTGFTLEASKIRIKEKFYPIQGKVSVLLKDLKVDIDYGDKIEIRGRLSKLEGLENPGVSSFSSYLQGKGIYCQFFCYSKPRILSRKGGNILVRLGIAVRNKFLSVIKETMPEPYSSLFGSIVFGSSASPISPETEENYRKAGVIHLLVASGTQVSILIGVCLSLVRSFNIPLWFGVIFTSIINLLFTIMTGAGSSIVRATIMGEITMLGLAFEREKDFYTSLALAALVLLIINPLNLFDLGFQLSFAATWALVYIAPVISGKLSKFPKLIAEGIAVSAAPVLATTPITFYNFSQISIAAFFTNFLIITWVEVLVVLGFASTAGGVLFLPIAQILNGTNILILKILDFIVSTISHFQFSCIYMPQPTFPIIIGYYVILIGAIEILRRGQMPAFSKSKLVIALLFIVSIFIWNSQSVGQPPNQLAVTVLDVGQGDSILVEIPSGQKMLIDGGDGKAGKRVVVPVLKRKGINKLDIIVLTHPHDDHVGGLYDVLKDIKVDLVLEGGQPHTSSSYYRFLKIIEEKKIPYKLARAGQTINLGEVKGYILNPTEPFLEGTNSDLNNNSVAIRLIYNKVKILLAGDIEKEGEGRILEFFPDLRADVLKAGHHGSKTSSSSEFLEGVKPKIAIISVGKRNNFFHPHPSTLERLRNHGIKIYRTDLNGAVMVKTDGEKYLIETAK